MSDNKKRILYETLNKFFGEEWISRQLNRIRIDGYNDTNPMNLARMDVHPLIKAILHTQIKLARAKPGKEKIAIGKSEILQNLLHINLTELENKLDFENVRNRLKDKKEFVKVEYELAIAAGYSRMGFDVEFIKPTNKNRTPEFVVTDKSGYKVVIECKKKDSSLKSQITISSWWGEFQHLLMSSLKKIKKYYGVIIFIPINPNKSDTHKIKNEIIKLVNSDLEGSFNLSENYKVILKKFCDGDNAIASDIFEDFPRAHEVGSGVRSIKRDRKTLLHGNDLTKEYFQPIGIYGKSPSEFIDERVEGIILTIASAYGQLSETIPNIVYIDINIATMTPEVLKKVLIKLLPTIEKKFIRDYSKISAVIVTNLKLLGYSDKYGFKADEYIIINPNAKNKLSSSFRIYGDLDNGQSILKDMEEVFDKN